MNPIHPTQPTCEEMKFPKSGWGEKQQGALDIAAEGSRQLERTVFRVEGAGRGRRPVYSVSMHGEPPEW